MNKETVNKLKISHHKLKVKLQSYQQRFVSRMQKKKKALIYQLNK